MKQLSYWLLIILLAALTIVSFRFTVIHGWTAMGMVGLAATLVLVAVLLSFSLSMRDRDRRGPPIPR